MSETMRFYTVEDSERPWNSKRKRTPEGFMLIEGVPLARIGEMLYGPNEVPVDPGPEGYITVSRDAAEVFRPETIASMNGKPVTNNHPDEDVMPHNWRQLALGTVMNARRGEGIEDDFLIGDILITDQMGIDLVDSGKVELSCGYDADYETTAPGRGRQYNIYMNHLALVDKGRCGPRCSIGDRKTVSTPKETTDMTKFEKMMAGLRSAFEKQDKTSFDALLETVSVVPTRDRAKDEDKDDNDKKTEDRIATVVRDAMGGVMKAIDERFEKIEEKLKDKAKDEEKEDDKTKDKEEEEETKDNEKILGELEFEAPPGTNDAATLVRKARDSAFMGESFQETVALAEILAPGIKVPTFDRAADPKKTFDSICTLRRRALDLTSDRVIVDAVTGGRGIDTKKATCDQVRSVFLAAGAMKRQHNNASSHVIGTRDNNQKVQIRTPADHNARMREYWAKKNGTV